MISTTPKTTTHKSNGISTRIFFTLLFAAVLFCLCSIKGKCAEEELPRNTSGNLNYDTAVDPIENSDDSSVILYNIKNGLPISEVNAVAQTDDGFIWIGSYSGLIRYDGTTFERPDIASSITNVRCLFIDRNNRLWIGSNDSGVHMIEGETLSKWDRTNGLSSLSIRSITEDANGNIYVSSTDGIGVIDSSMSYNNIDDENLLGHTIIEVRSGADNLVYGVSSTGDIYVLKDGKLISFLPDASSPFDGVSTILQDPNSPDLIYVGTAHHIYHGSLQDLTSWEKTDVAPLSGIESLEYIDGKVWICSRTGLGRLDGKEISILENLPIDNSFDQIMTDRDGIIWVVSARQGLMKIVPNRFLNLFSKYDIEPVVVNSTCMADDTLYIGTETGLIAIKNDAVVTTIPITSAQTASGVPVDTTDLIDFLKDRRIRSIIKDSTGAVWISVGGEPGLVKYSQGSLIQFTHKDGLMSDSIRVVSECSDRSMLVATIDGINIIKDDKVIKGYGRNEGLGVRLILSLTEGFNNEIIAGSDGGGIYVIKKGSISQFGLADGLKSEMILRIKKSNKQNLYWIVTSNSLAYMTPDYQVTTVQNFPYSNNYDILETANGNLWILGSSGIYVISAKDILEGNNIDPTFIGISNGLPFVATSNSHNALTETGFLYISGSEGVIKVDTNSPAMITSAVHAVLPYIDADGEHYYPNSKGEFTVPRNARKLTIRPYVINYSLADPDISYRLEGFDLTDTAVKSSELGSLTYTNLPTGTYHFSMNITNKLTGTDQEVSFTIRKGRTISFQAAASIIMDIISLFLLFAMLRYAALRGIRKRADDKLFFAMIAVTICLAFSDSISYYVEGIKAVYARPLMILFSTMTYISFALLPFMIFMYLYLKRDNDSSFSQKKAVLFSIPCFLYLIVAITNVWTGWIFYVTDTNAWKSGKMDQFIFIPVLFYFALSLIMLYRINWRLMLLCVLIGAFHIISDVLFHNICFTSFMYTLFLICAHVSVMEGAFSEEEL